MKNKSNPKPRHAPHGPSAVPVRVSTATQPLRLPLADSDFTPICLTLVAGLVFLTLLIWGLARGYHPDTAPLIKEGAELLRPEIAKELNPEPGERLRYVVCVFLTPLFLLGCLPLFKRFYRGAKEKNRHLYTWVANILLLAGTVAAPVLTYQALKSSGFLYVKAGVLFTHCRTYTLLLFPCVALLAFLVHKRCISWMGKIALYSMSVYMAVIVFFAVLFDRDTIWRWASDLNPVIYPLAQIMCGKTLLVDCAPLYGLYAHFLHPLFKLVPLNVYSFSVVMAILMMTCLAALWFFLRTITRNDFVLLAGFIAAVFYSYAGARIVVGPFHIRPNPYFQYTPIRMLFPCLLLMFSALYLRGVGKRWVYYAAFLCMALGTLWNLDSGVVAFGAWVALLGYVELFRNPWRASIRPILTHVVAAIGSLLLVFGGYALFAFLRSGVWPDWSLTVIYYKVFSYYGFYMIPMPGLPHMWGILVLIYVAAMVLAIHGLSRQKNELLCASLFLLAVLGAGRLGYYQGRSHDNCLFPLLYVPIAIMTLLADHILTRVKDGNRAYYKFLPLGALFFYFCASAVPSVFWQSSPFMTWIREGRKSSMVGSHGIHSRNIEFIRKQTKPGERVFILRGDYIDGLYYAETSTASVLDLPSSIDYFFKSDIRKIMNFLQENKSTKVFAVPGEYPDLTELFKSAYRVAAQEEQTRLALLLPNVGPRR